MLAAVLWLGNISFQVIDNENHVEVLADEGKICVWLCDLDECLAPNAVSILAVSMVMLVVSIINYFS